MNKTLRGIGEDTILVQDGEGMTVSLIAVGYPRKRNARTAAAEAIRLHCLAHRQCEVVSVKLRSYRGKANYWAVGLKYQ